MPISFFDQMFYEFRCENPKCGKVFKQILRSLLNVKEVSCPACGHVKNIEEAKRYGDLGKTFDTADQMDKQEAQKK